MAEPHRPVNKEEKRVIRWLLEHAATPKATPELIDTIDSLAVIDRCDCGCPTIDFVREGMGTGADILAQADGTALDGLPIDLVLWGRDGRISGLEVYNYDGGPWFPLPPSDHLRPSVLSA